MTPNSTAMIVIMATPTTSVAMFCLLPTITAAMELPPSRGEDTLVSVSVVYTMVLSGTCEVMGEDIGAVEVVMLSPSTVVVNSTNV